MTDYNRLTDEQLVELCRRDDDCAWSVLLSRYTSAAKIKVSIISESKAERDDLLQEGFIGLFSAVNSFDSAKNVSFKTYANVCIRNSIINAVNHDGKKNKISLDLSELENSEDCIDRALTPEELAISKSEVDALQKIISTTLSQKEKEVFRLFLGGFTYSEIAKKLGTSEKSVDGALQRARAKLKLALSE